MIRRFATVAVAALFLAACQTGRSQTETLSQMETPAQMATGSSDLAATSLKGSWVSTDGVFVAKFQGGTFTSKRTQNNTLLARGTFSTSGNEVRIRWASLTTNELMSATCTLSSSSTMRCAQAGIGGIDLVKPAT
jgi:hypothetical protein